VSVRAARDDRGVASLANVLGSNTFDLLVAIPVGVLIVGQWSFNFALAIPMFAVLTLATVLLFTALRTELALDGRIGRLAGRLRALRRVGRPRNRDERRGLPPRRRRVSAAPESPR